MNQRILIPVFHSSACGAAILEGYRCARCGEVLDADVFARPLDEIDAHHREFEAELAIV